MENAIQKLTARVAELERQVRQRSGSKEVTDNLRVKELRANKLFRKGAGGQWQEVIS